MIEIFGAVAQGSLAAVGWQARTHFNA